MKHAHQVKGFIKYIKLPTRSLPDGSDISAVYGELATRIEYGDKRYFCIQNEALCLKDRATSHDIMKKIPFVDMKFVRLLSKLNAICFIYLGDAWMFQSLLEDHFKDEEYTKLWTTAFMMLNEEAVKQHQGPTFPQFEVIENHHSAQIDFNKDEADFSYLSLSFRKARTMTLKAFDTSTIKIEGEKKRERSVEILSDED